MEEREEKMDDANKEEQKDVNDAIDDSNLNQTHDHVVVEEAEEKNPDSVNNVESETHDSVKDSEAQVCSTPTGTKSSEDAGNPAKPSVEVKVNSENGSLVSNVDTGRSHKGEVYVVIRKDGDDAVKGEEKKDGMGSKLGLSSVMEVKDQETKNQLNGRHEIGIKSSEAAQIFHWEAETFGGDESGTDEEQAAFMKEVESVYREKYLEWKPPKFYKEELNLLKLWRAVIKLGGYEQVTSCKLWRQVGESFKPPKTCTTVSWTFRNFYEKALLEYEKYKMHGNELPLPAEPARVENQVGGSQALGTGRALRDAAARAMQGWHSRRILSDGEVGDPIIMDKSLNSMVKSDHKHHKSSGLLKRKKSPSIASAVQVAHMKITNSQSDIMVFNVGPPADWVKVNVQTFDDCFEVYALVPGFLREEVHVQSDPAGRLVISGQPAQLDNPWGVTPFKKVVSLSSRIDPHHTSAVVTLNGQLYVYVPFEQSDL